MTSIRRIGLASALALSLAGAWPSAALPVEGATASVSAKALDQSESVSVEGPDAQLSLSEDASLPTFGDLSVSARAETFGGVPASGVPPGSAAELSVNYSAADPQNPTPFNFSPEPFAGGVLTYSVRVNERETPPIVFIPPIHVLVTLAGEASVTGPGDGRATANSAYAGIAESANASAANPFESYHRTFETTLTPGEAVGLSTGVGVRLTHFPQVSGSLALQAAADPVVEFDQAAFDAYAAQQGFQTFSLEDYYELEFSDGIVAPEPARAVLLVAGALALVVARAVARRAGSPPR